MSTPNAEHQVAVPRVVILGAGPAGAATAVGLRRLGYPVTCVTRPRTPLCLEGISERVYAALAGLGLTRGLMCISDPVPREVVWNGQASSANTERLIDRERFDAAILDDLRSVGVDVQLGTVEHCQQHDQTWQIQLQSGVVLDADFLVEARGRRAPRAHNNTKTPKSNQSGPNELVRGPESIALGQFWQRPDQPSTQPSVQALQLERGWGWLVLEYGGRVYTQLSLAADRTAIPARGEEADWIRSAFACIPEASHVLSAASPLGDASFRGSTSLLNDSVIEPGYLRIGDAAMAVDPLSGNGIFQSLSSALVAPAVINTLIKRPQDTALAQQFYEERLRHLFMRFARIGRDFYRQTSGPNLDEYWCQRQAWPDNTPAHSETDRVTGTAMRPVLNEGFIELAEVLVTENQPLGIWKIDGVSAVDRYRALLKNQNDSAK